MTRLRWRWEEKDFGFRFQSGSGRKKGEYYQAASAGEFYIVPASQRKLAKDRLDELAKSATVPASPRVVPTPWNDYDRDWDWISTADGTLLNYAGCLDRKEIDRREDEGVARAMEFVLSLIDKPEPASLTVNLIRQVHRELMGEIYPFAGEWRAVDLHKGDGPIRWPLPPCGIQPLMDVLERDVLARSPVLSEDDETVFAYVAEVMCEILALHPFREGNGRTAFIVGNLLLMQNDLVPLDVYDRRNDQTRYFAACDAGRIKDYTPLATLLADWEAAALAGWEPHHVA
ncbi:Fic family protein [uncultured Lamprocystis sp.]|jgi:cell filamentation protein|uniref:Fic/DOC family protein n=1 Tax=uncultured Lamprocystis sp. TaxID=543132 RepID=UPI0025F3CD71|nr:Fic family protein [uncultured Lamprocystis sp.]